MKKPLKVQDTFFNQIIGKTTIHPLLFYPGKVSGYILWGIGIYFAFSKRNSFSLVTVLIAAITFSAGAFFTIVSLLNLGSSVRLGLPTSNTTFKNKGLYSISRNPMYLGFNLLTLSAVIITRSLILLPFGLFSILVYHLIIRGEEKFLEERFGEEYTNYKQKVRRYL